MRAFYRKQDHAAKTGDLLEDKLFAVIEATEIEGELLNTWQRGLNAWMSADQLASQDKYFASTLDFIKMLEQNQQYVSHAVDVSIQDY